MPTLDENELAASYGWALSTINLIPDLRTVFRQAVAGSWTPARFVAAVRNTRWFKSLPASAREAEVLRTSDPAEWKYRVRAVERRVEDMFGQIAGAIPSNRAHLYKMAVTAMTFGWTDEQIRAAIGSFYDWQELARRGSLSGFAGRVESAIENATFDYGVSVSRDWIGGAVENVFAGKWTADDAVERIRQLAISAFPNLKARIEGGETVRQIADPYVQTMSRLLEISPTTIDLTDPKIRKALTQQTFIDPASSTRHPQYDTQPLWQFETEVRNDPRWRQTQNAQDRMAATTNSILRNMGLTA